MKVNYYSLYRFVLPLCLLTGVVINNPAHALAQLQLTMVQSLGDNTFELTGQFGSPCASCEIIANYGANFRYAYRPKAWQPNRIELQVDDLNRELDIVLQVHSDKGASNPQRIRLQRKVMPATELQQAVPTTQLDSVHFYERTHQLAIGDKGEDSFDVSTAPPSCGQQALVFDQARIVYSQQRFAQAQVVQSPTAGCVSCSPLTVRWYHEPTGKLTYQLHVYRRRVSGVCAGQLRK
jgi:hypothetical protein